jgi:hypothetical protein
MRKPGRQPASALAKVTEMRSALQGQDIGTFFGCRSSRDPAINQRNALITASQLPSTSAVP